MQHMQCRKSPTHYLTLLALTPLYAKMKTDFNVDFKKKKWFYSNSSFCESKKRNLIELLNNN